MADPQTGMDKAEMKKLLSFSKKEPVHCAMGLGKEPAFALLLLDKMKQPKAIEGLLVKQFPDAKSTRWGMAAVDIDENPKLVKFTINKPVSGIARKLAKTLKGTGFTKVEIVLEDGTAVESHADEEEDAGASAAAPSAQSEPQAASPSAAPPPPAPPPPMPARPGIDKAALEKRLAALIPRIPLAAAKAPDLQKVLVKLATDSNVNLKTGNLATAQTFIDELEHMLGDAPAGTEAAAAPQQAAAAPAAAPAASASGPVAYAKSRLAWLAARQKVHADIDKLRASIVEDYRDDEVVDDLATSYSATVQPVLDGFDESLADKLDEAASEPDAGRRSELVAEARGIISRYETFLANDTLIADLDDNPFVPLSIHATISATLAALSKAVH